MDCGEARGLQYTTLPLLLRDHHLENIVCSFIAQLLEHSTPVLLPAVVEYLGCTLRVTVSCTKWMQARAAAGDV